MTMAQALAAALACMAITTLGVESMADTRVQQKPAITRETTAVPGQFLLPNGNFYLLHIASAPEGRPAQTSMGS